MKVVEMLASINGEGPCAGELALFVRFQGCNLRCSYCDTMWANEPDCPYAEQTPDEIVDTILQSGITNVTLTGGEPFCQPEACAEIARGAHALGLNVWTYTGYLFEEMLNGTDAQRELLRNTDVLVDGPFKIELKSLDVRFRGSKNQRLIDVPKSLNAGRTVELE